MSGLVSYCAGLAAEDGVERHYAERGHVLAARRWRGAGGEIDLVLRSGTELVFVEVKRSRTTARAVERLSAAQIARLQSAAEEFCAGEPAGLLTPMRFDVAAVDGTGRVTILENAIA